MKASSLKPKPSPLTADRFYVVQERKAYELAAMTNNFVYKAMDAVKREAQQT